MPAPYGRTRTSTSSSRRSPLATSASRSSRPGEITTINVIPKLEAAQDPFTRMAEDMLQRAHKEKPFFLRARAYAVQVRNDKCAHDQKATRFHRHHAAPSDVTHYIFGTLCAVLKDGHNSQRAPVGSAERTDNAILIGYEPLARKRMLLKVDTQQIIYRKDVQPLNEMALLRMARHTHSRCPKALLPGCPTKSNGA